jgi:hypothetical protein
MNSEWYQHNNMAVKLRDALETVINGHGLPYIFKGLDTGKCSVEVIYNGETCTFVGKNPTLNDTKTPTHIVEEKAEDTENYNIEFEPPKEKRRRKSKIEAVVLVGDGVKAEF